MKIVTNIFLCVVIFLVVLGLIGDIVYTQVTTTCVKTEVLNDAGENLWECSNGDSFNMTEKEIKIYSTK